MEGVKDRYSYVSGRLGFAGERRDDMTRGGEETLAMNQPREALR